MVEIKKEKWKGGFRWVARDEKKRVVSWVSTRKIPTKLQARERFARNGTFQEGVQRVTRGFKNYAMYVVSQKDNKLRKNVIKSSQYQVLVEGTIKGRVIHGVSRKLSRSVPTEKLKEEAITNFWERVVLVVNGFYDRDIDGEDEYGDMVDNIRYSIVYFAPYKRKK